MHRNNRLKPFLVAFPYRPKLWRNTDIRNFARASYLCSTFQAMWTIHFPLESILNLVTIIPYPRIKSKVTSNEMNATDAHFFRLIQSLKLLIPDVNGNETVTNVKMFIKISWKWVNWFQMQDRDTSKRIMKGCGSF